MRTRSLLVAAVAGIAARLLLSERRRRAVDRPHPPRPTGVGAPESVGVGKPVGLVR